MYAGEEKLDKGPKAALFSIGALCEEATEASLRASGRQLMATLELLCESFEASASLTGRVGQ